MFRKAALVLMLASAGAAGQPEQIRPIERDPLTPVTRPSHREPRRVIEVVFVLDTTGSMSGLIEGAKQKIWSIANRIVAAEPRPEIRMGLVGYRDRGDEYVTTSTALTDDLDAVYSDLMAYAAAGGGDTPESVNQALHEAVTEMDWTPRDAGGDVLRIVYLVGDAPPHTDYEQDVAYAESCETAARRGIIVNAIQCGTSAETAAVWREISRLGEGEYFAIEQSGGVVALSTPYDDELEALSTRLGETLIAYGSREDLAAFDERRERAGEIADAAPAAAIAERALYLASEEDGATLGGDRELVRDYAQGRVALGEIPEEELPEELRGLSPEERAAFLERRAGERDAIRAQIREVSERRSAFIRDELERLGGEGDAFDRKVLESLREQAARIGIEYGDG